MLYCVPCSDRVEEYYAAVDMSLADFRVLLEMREKLLALRQTEHNILSLGIDWHNPGRIASFLTDDTYYQKTSPIYAVPSLDIFIEEPYGIEPENTVAVVSVFGVSFLVCPRHVEDDIRSALLDWQTIERLAES